MKNNYNTLFTMKDGVVTRTDIKKSLSTAFEKINGRFTSIRNIVTEVEPQNMGDHLLDEVNLLEEDVSNVENCISKIPEEGTIPFFKLLGIVLTSMLLGVLLFVIIIGFLPSPNVNMADCEPHELIVGEIGVTSKEYIYKFNKSFIGYIVDVNKTNRSKTSLITLQNGDEEIILNEYWIQYVNEYWFEETYSVDYTKCPSHFNDYNGTYQLVDNYFDPISKDWEIIHTIDGKIRLEHYSPEDEYRLYYYNNTYIGGAQLEYVNNKFVIISSGEEVEYQKII